jgi:hypothetical protein
MASTHDGDRDRRIDRLETRVDKHDDRIGALGGVVGRLTGEVDQLTTRVGRHATQHDALASQVNELEQADRDDRRERFKGWLTFASAVIVALIGAYVALKTGAVGSTK